jgi:Tn3 transposase DDE domain
VTGPACAGSVRPPRARFPDRGHEAPLNRASDLSLATYAIVIWDTRYLAAAADRLAQHGQAVPDAVWSHLSPLH